MKNLRFIFFLFLSLSVSTMSAQSFKDRTLFECMAGTGIQNNDKIPLDLSFKLRVDIIPLAYMFITVEDNISLFKNKEARTYSNGASLGGGIGVKLLNHSKGDHALDVRIKSLQSLGSPDWKRTTYDAGLAWYLKSEKFSPIVELGYRFLDSRTKGIDNYGNAYLSIGLRY